MAQFVIVALIVLTGVGNLQIVNSISPGIQHLKQRNKRHVGEISVQSVLQSFISRLDTMKKQIKRQDNKFNRQNKEIKDLKWYIKRKSTQERLDEVTRDVDHQTALLKHAVDIKSLKIFKNAVDKFGLRHNALSSGVKERKRVIDDIYSRIMFQDSKIECRNTFTSWKKQADYKIGSLDKHLIECNEDELLQRFLLQRKDGGLDSVIRFKYSCCRFNVKDKWKRTPKKPNT